MIFVSVGTQLGFDRLLKMLDIVQEHNNLKFKIFAQIGSSRYVPKHYEFENSMNQKDFNERLSNSSVIVSHAGMGNIITALSYKKPIIIIPRLSAFGEHRNDHQVHTANSFAEIAGVYVATDFDSLNELLNKELAAGELNQSSEIFCEKLLRKIETVLNV